MAVVATRLILTPTFDDTKRMTVQGTAAVNEDVAVTVVGVAVSGSVPSGLVLRLTSHCGRQEYARFPADTGDTWTGDGSNATCTLRLNTAALQAVFQRLCDDAVCDCLVKLENGNTNNLYGTGRTVIRNWIQNPRDPVAGSLEMQAEIDTLASRIASHQHAGDEDSAQFPHNNLLDRDAEGAHPAIENAILNLGTTVGINTGSIATLKGRMDTLAAAADTANPVTPLNADDDLVSMSAVYAAIRALTSFVNSVKGGL